MKTLIQHLSLVVAVGLVLSSVSQPLRADVRILHLGKNGTPWTDVAERIIGLEDTTAFGSIQPQELFANQNILLGPPTERQELTSFFGYKWALEKVGRGADFELGVNPRFWTATYSSIYHGGPRNLIDGDPNSVIKVINVPVGGIGRDQLYTFDFGFPVPINRVVFFPPDNGIDELGGLRKQRFPRAYEISAALEPTDFLLLTEESGFHTLDRLLSRTFFNANRVVEVEFPTQIFRFLRISFNLVAQEYLLGEIQIFGEGFVPVTSYRSVILSLDEPVNFGRIHWNFEKFSAVDSESEALSDPDAPVNLILETRTGRDDSPRVYTLLNEIGAEEIVDMTTFQRAPEPSIRLGARPGDKESIQDDLDNWSPWSTPYRSPGELLRSPDGREFLQLQFRIESEDHRSYGRLDSISIEYSPLLVESLVGEVGLVGAGPLEPGATPAAPAGVDTTFVYDFLAGFGPRGRLGFNVVRISTHADAQFTKLEIGDPLVEVVPDSVRSEAGELVVYFPSNKVSRTSGSERVRVQFRTKLLDFSTHFLAEVAELDGENLPQSVDPGNASEELDSDDIRVFVDTPSLDVISSLDLSTSVLTPNGDGANDVLQVDLTLLGIATSKTKIGVYDMSGRRLRQLADDDRGRGASREVWDGRDDSGNLVPPGTYLLRVLVETDNSTAEELRVMPVVY